jgi:hypothetical protein
MGMKSSDDATVSVEVCEACCRSFPPSLQNLNPVVGSLLHTAAARIRSAGGIAGCPVEEAERIERLAENSLDVVFPEQYRLTPARTVAACCWLGDRVEPNGSAPLDAATGMSASEPIFNCCHPAHGRVSAEDCRRCRDWTKQPNVSRFLSLLEMVPPPARRSGRPVQRWAVGVTTAPRRRPTLETCLDGIVRAGWNEIRLFLDGAVRVPARYNHLSLTWREQRIGPLPAWYLALSELVHQEPQADAYLILQDDVVLYDRESLRAYLEGVLWPGDRPGLLSLFYTGQETIPGWRCTPGEWHWGAQAFLFAPGIARALLSDADVVRTSLTASVSCHIPIPEVVCDWIQRTGIDVWHPCPSLAQHIGNTSTIWPTAAITGGRRAPWFSGSVETAFAVEESFSGFPEDAFPCDSAVRDDYRARVQRGRKRMAELSVVICGLCRDVRHYLPKTASRVERLGQMFSNYRAVLFENDSVDATREFLFDWQAVNPQVEVISESHGTRRFPQTRCLERAAWLAYCRNRCRERAVSQYAHFDFVIVLDTDLPGGWSYDGLAHTLAGDDWDFVGSYGLRQRVGPTADESPYCHFDTWAFRPAAGTPARTLVDHNSLQLQRGGPLLPVESCFGGLGVYRMDSFQSVEYGDDDCEHVVFHNRLRAAGFHRLYLNPSQIVMYSPL